MWVIKDHLALKATYSGASVKSQGFCLGLVCFLDRYPDTFRLYLARRDTDLKDSPVVAGGDVLGVHPGGQLDQPGERAVTEL